MAPKRYTICVDFDGVLHSYQTPYSGDGEAPDPPVPGAIEWLSQIAEHFDVVIHTTRARSPEGQRAVRHWLHEHGWEPGMNATVTAQKVPALVYIDDRAWRFDGVFPTKDEIHRALPWHKGVAEAGLE
jgi:hypothetical protein